VFFNPEKLKAKNLELITEADIKMAFGNNNLKVFDDPKKLEEYLTSQSWANKNLLMMSSGNFAGFDIKTLAERILA
jgi:UDP-N-acetylmuramate: L-alanyl-gamma-D-glutamyl-meso-diaminopimelate ligase